MFHIQWQRQELESPNQENIVKPAHKLFLMSALAALVAGQLIQAQTIPPYDTASAAAQATQQTNAKAQAATEAQGAPGCAIDGGCTIGNSPKTMQALTNSNPGTDYNPGKPLGKNNLPPSLVGPFMAPRYGNFLGMNMVQAGIILTGGAALDDKGTVYTWGWNQDGELGIGMPYSTGISVNGSSSTTPACNYLPVGQMASAIQPKDLNCRGYAGGYETVDFFQNPQKYLKLTQIINPAATAPELAKPTTIQQIATSYYAMAALDTQGRVWAWGLNDTGAVGKANTTASRTINASAPNTYNFPQLVQGLPANIAGIRGTNNINGSTGQFFALTSAGQVWTWGSNVYGKLGIGSSAASSATPKLILFPAGTVIQDVGAGDTDAIALDSQGNVWYWGTGPYVPTNAGIAAGGSTTPVKLTLPVGIGKVLAISAGNYAKLLLAQNPTDPAQPNQVWQWGGNLWYPTGVGYLYTNNAIGQLQIEPSEIIRLGYAPSPQKISAGNVTSDFIDQYGRPWVWGYNIYYGFGREGGYQTNMNIATAAAYQYPQVIGDGDTQPAENSPKTPADGAPKNPTYGTYGLGSMGAVGDSEFSHHPTIYDDKYLDSAYSAVPTVQAWKNLAFQSAPMVKTLINTQGEYIMLDYDGNIFKWGNDGSGALAWGNGQFYNSKYDGTAYYENGRDGTFDRYGYEVVLSIDGGAPPPPAYSCDAVTQSAASASASGSRLTSNTVAYVAGYSDSAAGTANTIGGWSGSLAAYAGNNLTQSLWSVSIPTPSASRGVFTTGIDAAGFPAGMSLAVNGTSNGLNGGNASDILAATLTPADINAVRANPLGPIVDSTPAYVAQPSRLSLDPNYAAFVKAVNAFNTGNGPATLHRQGVVYVGANDGMLHGFDAGQGTTSASGGYPGTGKELMAYVPRGLLGFLHNTFANSSYKFGRYWVDSSPFSGDAQLGAPGAGTTSAANPGNWGTVLAGALGKGGPGYFVLDVTQPTAFAAGNLVLIDATNPTDTSTPNVNPLANQTITSGPDGTRGNPVSGYIGSQVNQPVMDMYTTNQTGQIVQINTNKTINVNVNGKPQSLPVEWAVIMGNGYGIDLGAGVANTPGVPVLLVQSLTQHVDSTPNSPLALYTVAATCTAGAACTTAGVGNGLGAPRAIDVDGNGTADIVYAGDLMGNLWKFDISNPDHTQWKIANADASGNPAPLFTAVGPTGAPQPITSAPLAVPDSTAGGFMVAFGTGKNLINADTTDALDPVTQAPLAAASVPLNSVYAVYDNETMTTTSATVPGTTVAVSQVLLGASTASQTKTSLSPIPAKCLAGSGGASRYDTGSGGCLHMKTGGAISSGSAITVGGVTVTTNQSSSATASNYSLATGVDGDNGRGWYYDIPEADGSNAAKVLSNPMMWSANTMMFYSQTVSITALNSTTVFCTSPVPTVNFFDIFHGNPPSNTFSLGGVVQYANRYQIGGMTTAITNGTDSLTPLGKMGGPPMPVLTQKINPAGRRVGWRIVR
jgi:alpha-tubulin suppressor-like RCC1 family protein